MKISGFTFVRNASRYYIPILPAIKSILPIVDEFVIALGKGDEGDDTQELLESLNDPKIKIVHTEWDIKNFPKLAEYARQTDIAKSQCSGDWLFYIQGDEAIHEKYLSYIHRQCEKYLEDSKVEGFTFKYKHFWGDYRHYNKSHAWYSREIRIIRNLKKIHSWKDAQSFRYYEHFKESFESYYDLKNPRKLNIIELDAYMYHYGFVRPPKLLKAKKEMADQFFHQNQSKRYKIDPNTSFDYGPLQKLTVFKGQHPEVMKDWIETMDWQDLLQFDGPPNPVRKKHKHEKLRYKIHSWVENTFMDGAPLWGFKNYQLIGKAEKFE